MRLVGSKCHVEVPSPAATGSGVGELDTTAHSDGAVTWNVKTALRSGCSNVVNTRRASGTSNCV